jgi:Na+-transporting methylmalonyl-CoA/oxaloacetate decarboxylase gamma subunit
VGVAVFAFFGFCFLLATIAVALDIVLPLWAAMLIVTGMLFLLVAILSLVGRNLIMSVKNPAPEKAMAEARATADAVKRGALSVVRRRAAPPEMAAAGATATAADTPPSEPSGAPCSEPGGDSAT